MGWQTRLGKIDIGTRTILVGAWEDRISLICVNSMANALRLFNYDVARFKRPGEAVERANEALWKDVSAAAIPLELTEDRRLHWTPLMQLNDNTET